MTHSFNRRQLLQLSSAIALSAAGLVHAQGTAGRIVVGFPPGGTLDVLARLLAPHFSKGGMTVVVENKPGASAQLGPVAVKQAPPDGSSMLLTPTSVLTLTTQLFRKPLVDPLHDLAPVGSVCEHPFAFAVSGSSPIKSMDEFIAWVKARGREANFAHPGAGTSPHFLGMILAKEAGIKLTHVPYRGTAPGLQDLIGGQVDSTMNALPAMIEYHKGGRLRILATTGSQRLASLPDVPTFSELKISGLEYAESFGIFVSAATPGSVVARLETALQQAVASPEMAEAAKRMEMQLRGSSAAAYKQLFEADYKRWSGIAKESGFTLDA
ncbi:ABC transporter substrate-binding protein [Variovorax paradoxus]|uniref:ABC transporter substrate-binding protein n=1 Tax=Variovorax paradoxus TaxID=34073 RepID=A0A5Q0M917_VARPD|nr:tripartite tricarboxylate transporter substrate-binding protein [Variovorax paradoxus]QFZ85124.1 ABC transporter substrate-binding protein [Variovorax paradoxus]